MGILIRLFSGIAGKLAVVAAALGGIFLWGRSKQREGQKKAESAQLKKTAQIRKKQAQVKRPKNVKNTLDRL